ncbi:MAG: Gfo/Idh/MocA family oxidoreductase [Verrucomicrobia bacterium]|nr:Gfo/Idh/MocA family oxidoreductase [Verrucomicrobiota bacterium]
MKNLTRRRFLEDSMLAAAAVAAAAAVPSPARAQEKTPGSPSDRIRVAILGCRIRGKQHAQELARIKDCEITHVCDPDRDLAAELAATVEKQQGRAPKAVQDMRRIFDDREVDAVFIATPNHWHALAAIWAMQAGKDAYVEKPVSHNVSEGRRIVQVARKTGRICQGGTQNRSNGALAAAVDYIKQGRLGQVKLARSIIYGGRGSIGAPGRFEIPAAVDYNLFAGPAPMGPLTRPRFHYDWHWFWDTGNGELGNNNVHSLDICRWGLGVTGLGRSVVSFGGRLGYADAGETPNTQVCVFDFGDKTIVSETRGLKTAKFRAEWPDFKGSWIFEGTEGFIAGTSLFDRDGRLVRTFPGKTASHFANFLQAVRSRNRAELNAEILEGHQSSALCHLGNISWRLGRGATPAEIGGELGRLTARDAAREALGRTVAHLRENNVDLAKTPLTLGAPLQLHPEREVFVNQPRANALLTREYRKPFVVPGEAEV